MNKEKKGKPFGISDKFAYMMGDFGCNAVLSLAVVTYLYSTQR